MFLFQDIRWRPRGIPAKVILAIGLVIALPVEAATPQERTPPPEHVLPIIPPPFHFSDQAMDREHSRLVRGVDSALE